MTGRVYMGEVLIQIWLKSKEMSELLDKQVNVQKESLKNLLGSGKLPQAHEKVCDENETNKQRKKTTARQKSFCGRKDFIRPYQKTD